MKVYKTVAITLIGGFIFFNSCKKDDKAMDDTTTPTSANLIFKFKFDSTQTRLNNFGASAVMPSNHRAQSPKFNSISAHYLELAPSQNTLLGNGEILYKGEETTAGGNTAVDFDKATVVAEGEIFKSIPISSISPGTYNWIRVSLTYQNYVVSLRAAGNDYKTNLTSFVGYNTYISTHSVGGENIVINDDKLQGYWALKLMGITYPAVQGQAPAGATTVPNPNWQNSPIPQGSCVVTGEFSSGLTISGNETKDVVVTLSLSTNNSFEWKEKTGDNIYEPSTYDTIVDMGLRGLIPIVD